MNDLIAALQILGKYQEDTEWPTHCEHDILMVTVVEKDDVPEDEQKELDKLGFFWNEEHECWTSYRFGSA
jgi:hypothetical protein